MQRFVIAAAFIALVPFVAATINTPASVKECEPSQFQFDGVAPYYFSVIPGGQPSGTPYRSLPAQNTNTMVWKCDIPQGTSVSFVLKDGTGAVSYSDKVTIGAGTDKSCLVNSGSSPAPNAAPASVAPAAQAPNAGPIPGGPPQQASVSSVSHSSGSVSSSQTSTHAVVQAVTTTGGASSAASATHSSTSGAGSQISLANSGLTGLFVIAGAILF
ncbi:hypothetical protein CPB83DRAFT_900411 [Crepidotus variabilis]|uniref:Uncharacterized protein n=1 Tax=Crepidotus variabilis TaxID=179855 RepID=A0A9P6E377_9AGAR|nr:hypothetical protein CPB83DRAFT_900411 [Crepidotus variabilis]